MLWAHAPLQCHGRAHQLGVVADEEAAGHAAMQSGLLAAQRTLVKIPRRDTRPAQHLLARAELLRLFCICGKQQTPGTLPLHLARAQVWLPKKPLPLAAALARQVPGCAGWIPMRQPDIPLPCTGRSDFCSAPQQAGQDNGCGVLLSSAGSCIRHEAVHAIMQWSPGV